MKCLFCSTRDSNLIRLNLFILKMSVQQLRLASDACDLCVLCLLMLYLGQCKGQSVFTMYLGQCRTSDQNSVQFSSVIFRVT